jgi:C-terminal processing protease CtpA/Prc
MRLTTAKFYSPKGKPYSGVGVEPDVPVQQARVAAKPVNGQLPAGEDAMLTTAVKIARNAHATLQAAR